MKHIKTYQIFESVDEVLDLFIPLKDKGFTITTGEEQRGKYIRISMSPQVFSYFYDDVTFQFKDIKDELINISTYMVDYFNYNISSIQIFKCVDPSITDAQRDFISYYSYYKGIEEVLNNELSDIYLEIVKIFYK